MFSIVLWPLLDASCIFWHKIHETAGVIICQSRNSCLVNFSDVQHVKAEAMEDCSEAITQFCKSFAHVHGSNMAVLYSSLMFSGILWPLLDASCIFWHKIHETAGVIICQSRNSCLVNFSDVQHVKAEAMEDCSEAITQFCKSFAHVHGSNMAVLYSSLMFSGILWPLLDASCIFWHKIHETAGVIICQSRNSCLVMSNMWRQKQWKTAQRQRRSLTWMKAATRSPNMLQGGFSHMAFGHVGLDESASLSFFYISSAMLRFFLPLWSSSVM